MKQQHWLLRQALALIQAERTRKLWTNPLSIYAPDPVRLAVVEFNAGKAEHMRELRAGLEDFRASLREVHASLKAGKVREMNGAHRVDTASVSTKRKNWSLRVPGVRR